MLWSTLQRAGEAWKEDWEVRARAYGLSRVTRKRDQEVADAWEAGVSRDPRDVRPDGHGPEKPFKVEVTSTGHSPRGWGTFHVKRSEHTTMFFMKKYNLVFPQATV